MLNFIDDIWGNEPNHHLRILNGQNGGVILEICNCGMSGNCKPLARISIAKYNQQRIGVALSLLPLQPACLLCEKGFPVENGEHYGTQSAGMIPTTKCTAAQPAATRDAVAQARRETWKEAIEIVKGNIVLDMRGDPNWISLDALSDLKTATLRAEGGEKKDGTKS